MPGQPVDTLYTDSSNGSRRACRSPPMICLGDIWCMSSSYQPMRFSLSSPSVLAVLRQIPVNRDDARLRRLLGADDVLRDLHHPVAQELVLNRPSHFEGAVVLECDNQLNCHRPTSFPRAPCVDGAARVRRRALFPAPVRPSSQRPPQPSISLQLPGLTSRPTAAA